ncbi:unnamed protein product [Bubo scandiacus]
MNNVSYFDHRMIIFCFLSLYHLGRAVPRLTRRNTPTNSCGHKELRQRFSLTGPDSTASKPQIH